MHGTKLDAYYLQQYRVQHLSKKSILVFWRSRYFTDESPQTGIPVKADPVNEHGFRTAAGLLSGLLLAAH